MEGVEEDEDVDGVEVSRSSEKVVRVEALREWGRSSLDEGDKFAFVGDDKAVSDTDEFGFRGTVVPLTTKSPLFSLQHASARVPFPQQ